MKEGTEDNVVAVIVVGAGLSGMLSAYRLQQKGNESVVVLEGRPYLGGRMRGTTVGDDNAWVDYGGQWLGPTQHKMLALLEEFGIQKFDYKHGCTRLECNGKRADFKGDMCFAMFPKDTAGEEPLGIASPEEIEDARQAWKKIQDIIDGFKEGDRAFDHEDAAELDGATVYSWMRANTGTCFANFFFEHSVASLGPIGVGHVSTVSVLHFAWAQFMSPQTEMPEKCLIRGGAGQIPPILADKIGGDRIKLGQDVVQVTRAADGIIAARTSEGNEFRGKALNMAVPPAVACNPPLTAQRHQLMQRFPMGTIAKVLVAYPEKHWYENDLVMCVSNQAKCTDFTADASDPGKTTGVIAAFIQGTKYFEWERLSLEEQKDAVLKDLVHLYGKPEMMNATAIEIGNWPKDQFVGGGYSGTVPPGVWTNYGPGIRNTEWDGHLDFAGTEHATRRAGCFEGCAISADAAVERILSIKL